MCSHPGDRQLPKSLNGEILPPASEMTALPGLLRLPAVTPSPENGFDVPCFDGDGVLRSGIRNRKRNTPPGTGEGQNPPVVLLPRCDAGGAAQNRLDRLLSVHPIRTAWQFVHRTIFPYYIN